MKATSLIIVHGLAVPTTILIVVALAGFGSVVHGFSSRSGLSGFKNLAQSNTEIILKSNSVTTSLFGILDDIMEEENSDAEDDASNDDERLVALYHSLIFASDLQSEISKRLEECTDRSFLDYLTASSESTKDEGEQQGLQELINQINEVKAAVAKKAVEEEQAAIAAKAEKEKESETATTTTPDNNTKPLSNTDILRKANEIDAAIALSDEEKPSDFISDCREVVNLSRGFNDSGQMRVGGR
eukprot:CAMPEP_0172384830 /NCGR_PEP_ID=MMETSP1061-20121228/2558_1 /TAXON_ID=37318 /ORGANISM="Pseudo-nitzschia pungens, Strain cf. pungens" /LENGTH=242 /DNA_ID=CAMNT_0013113611 /DNA_START=88 /DNA_END=816 /DNA_ORIENTATION=-